MTSQLLDYTYLYRSSFHPESDWPGMSMWDVFLSAYTRAERVQYVFDRVSAREKRWLVAPEYGFEGGDFPQDAFVGEGTDEATIIRGFVGSLQAELEDAFICVDTTGFIRPHLLFLMRWLFEKGVRRFDSLYSEPGHYQKREQTEFSRGAVGPVRQVVGFEGVHTPDTTRDLIVIGAGYDHELISLVAENKEHATKVQMFGLPSLRADMYQENVLRAFEAENSIGTRSAGKNGICYAPAHDPFETAMTLRQEIEKYRQQVSLTNLYLSPLATKPQTLGFGLYYLTECRGTATSIIFPFKESYSRETTQGISRIWRYTIEYCA